ncbi:MAG: 5-formyltetrahydrofolate cyclo-ligase [Ruminococcaceae bacterium]|nr:5-formyltetrahydrofolate cyclo-ligase [Oscillospiraceae bacterium]
MKKQKIRDAIKKQKKNLSKEYVDSYSKKVSEIFLKQDFYFDATVLYTYLAFNTEIDTKGVIKQAWSDGKKVAVPKVLDNDVLEFFYITSFDDISNGYCNIPEPEGKTITKANDENVLLIVPGLAFDKSLNRIGYGGGFYDKYLERNADKSFLKVSFAYDFQVLDNIETEEHDKKIDVLITKTAIIRK